MAISPRFNSLRFFANASSVCVTCLLVSISHVGVVHAEIFRRVDELGNVTITNIPPQWQAGPSGYGNSGAALPRSGPSSSRSGERISTEVQSRRDSDARQILENELRTETAALAVAEGKNDQAVSQRHRANLEAIRRELARLK